MINLLKIGIITILIFCSCTKEAIKIDKDNLLIGVWNYAKHQNNVQVYSRSRDFTNSYCYRFNADGSLTERNLAGWCATPPVSYSDYQGNWSMSNSNRIEISVTYWGGTRNYGIEILSVDSDTLKLSFISK